MNVQFSYSDINYIHDFCVCVFKFNLKLTSPTKAFASQRYIAALLTPKLPLNQTTKALDQGSQPVGFNNKK